MGYASAADLGKILSTRLQIDLTDDADLGVVDSDKIDNALEAADAEINVYLGERYSLPLTDDHAILKKIAADIAVVNLYSLRQGPPDNWQTRYDNDIDMLEKIRDGKLSLGIADPETGSSDSAEISSEPRIFTRDSLKSF
jgi:phage gp36-like protein